VVAFGGAGMHDVLPTDEAIYLQIGVGHPPSLRDQAGTAGDSRGEFGALHSQIDMETFYWPDL
jgi:hypothetical protein